MGKFLPYHTIRVNIDNVEVNCKTRNFATKSDNLLVKIGM
jgi:hypothetical protein